MILISAKEMMANGNEEGAQELINNKLKNLDPKDYPDINKAGIGDKTLENIRKRTSSDILNTIKKCDSGKSCKQNSSNFIKKNAEKYNLQKGIVDAVKGELNNVVSDMKSEMKKLLNSSLSFKLRLNFQSKKLLMI